jgi:CRISPR-associated protein Cmr3
MSQAIGLYLEPLDTLFCRDGRPFEASTRAESGLPQPRTLAGALRTRLVQGYIDLRRLPELRRRGQDIEQALSQLGCPDWVLRTHFRGPWLALGRGEQAEPLVPMPIILAQDGDRLVRSRPLEPRALPGWYDPHGLWPLWRAGANEAKPAGGFLKLQGLREFLEGREPALSQRIAVEKLYDFDERTGLRIDPDRLTGEDGMLYGVRLLALQRNVGLIAEVHPGPGAPADVAARLAGPLQLGGEGRSIRVMPRSRIAWPEVPVGERSLWLLITPAPLQQAHRPDNLGDCTVQAAATAAPLTFSGWDVARNGPEPTRFAVPAGAVYFVQGKFSPEDGSLCGSPTDRAVGWGQALRGVWQ